MQASTATLHENPARTNSGDPSSNQVAYTFSLEDPDTPLLPYSAEQPVTITYHFESTSGRALPGGVPSGAQTAVIATGTSSKTVGVTLGDDNYDRHSPQDGFRLVIDSVTGNEALVKALQEHVKAGIAPYKYPRAIAFVPALPKTATGKLQRFALRQLAQGES